MRIEKGRITIEDSMDKLVETEHGVACGCKNPSLKMVCHMDLKDAYSTSYSCSCGNSITVTKPRTEESMMLWGD